MLFAGAGEPAETYYDFYCKNNQTFRRARIVHEDKSSFTVKLELLDQPLRIPKRDLIRPPVLIAQPVAPEIKSPPAIVVAEKPTPVIPEIPAPLPWGKFSGMAHGFLALQDIRKFKTYGFGGYMQFMLADFISSRYRLFARAQVSRLFSEKYDSFFIPVYAGIHTVLFQVNPTLSFYGEVAVGLGYQEFTHGDAEKNSWRGSVQATLGVGYFIGKNFSLNLEFAALYITREQALPEMLRFQIAGVFHL